MAAARSPAAPVFAAPHPEEYPVLLQTIALAKNGLFSTPPNPRVGCVIYKDNRQIASGWHAQAGGEHAESIALKQINDDARGCAIFLSLEPCTHTGKTPPCVDAIIRAKPKRVVIAARDPNPEVNKDGDGLARLQAAGIQVALAAADSEVATQARALNIGFYARMERARPWVRLKIAATIDGKTAQASGASQWITQPAARADAHHWRARSCAVLTGVGTALQDDPLLTVRHHATPRQPLRVLVDSQRRLPLTARLFAGAPIVIAHAANQSTLGKQMIDHHTIALPNAKGKVDLAKLLAYLASNHQVNELLVEAGRKLNGALLAENLVDEVIVYFSAKIFGEFGRAMFAYTPPPDLLARAADFTITEAHVFDDGDARLILRKK